MNMKPTGLNPGHIMTETDMITQIDEQLNKVLDPCSCHTENPVSIIDLGLVEAVEVRSEGAIRIELVVTSPMCTYFTKMAEEIEERVLGVDGVRNVTVEKNTQQVWTPARMDDSERDRRRRWFEDKMNEHGITPITE